MSRQLILVEIVISIVLMLTIETKADILSDLGNLAAFGQCGIKVNNNENFSKCKEKATDDWKADANPKRQACCKPMAFMDCTLATAKELCGENEYKNLEATQKTALKASDKSCILYQETPSMCGTNAILPVLYMILLPILAVLRIS